MHEYLILFNKYSNSLTEDTSQEYVNKGSVVAKSIDHQSFSDKEKKEYKNIDYPSFSEKDKKQYMVEIMW